MSALDDVISQTAQKVQGGGATGLDAAGPTDITSQDATELAGQIADTALVDDSTLSTFKRGFAESRTFTESAGDVLTRKFPDSPLSNRLFVFQDEEGNFDLSAGIRTEAPQKYYGEDFFNLNEDEKRVRMNETRQGWVEKFYGETAQDTISGSMGQFTGFMTDPTSLIPVGASYKTAAVLGAGVAGSDVAMLELAERGEIEPVDVALAMSLGAALGPLMVYGGKVTSNWLQDIKSSGVPVTEKQVADHIGTMDVDPSSLPPVPAITEQINKGLGLGELSPFTVAVRKANDSLAGKTPISMEQTLFDQRMIMLGAAGKNLSKAQKVVLKDLDKKLSEVITPPKAKVKIKGGGIWAKSRIERLAAKAEAAAQKQMDDLEAILPKELEGATSKQVMEALDSDGIAAHGSRSPEEAIAKAIGEGDIPWTSPIGNKLYNPVGKVHFLDEPLGAEKSLSWAISELSHKWRERPSHYLKRLGSAGREAAEIFRRASEDHNQLMGVRMIAMNKLLVHHGITKGDVAYDQLADILRHTIKKADATPAAWKMAKEMRKHFNDAVMSAVKVGVLPLNKAKAMIAKAHKEGYFPRIYDQAYLRSRAGKKEWDNVLSNHAWSEKSLEHALKKILGQSFRKVKGITKQADGTYKITKTLAREMWKKRNAASFEKKSHHLEYDRTLELPDSVLKPFLLNDPIQVSYHYFDDVFKRVTMAAHAGADGTVVTELSKRVNVIHEGHGDNVMQLYHGMMGSSENNMIKQFIDLPQGTKDFYGTMTTIESAKLVLAQVATATQATVNGTILLARKYGDIPGNTPLENLLSTPETIYKSAKLLGIGFARTLTKAGREIGESSGASVQTTMMQLHGEMGGHGFTAALLQKTGFNASERLQRIFAANMGKAMLEDILKNKTRLLQRRATKGISNRQAKTLKHLDRQLLELGIDPRKDPAKTTVTEMGRAAQRFSNEVNFVVTPDQIPVWWNNPHAKLSRQYKSFVFFQGAFVKENVIQPLRRGNVAPLMMLAAGGYLGIPVDKLRQWIYADDEDYSRTEQWLRGIMAIGGAGLALDMAIRAVRGPGEIPLALAGPAYSDASKLLTGTLQSIAQSAKEGEAVHAPAVKGLLSFAPFAGRIKKELYPKKTKGFYDNIYEGKYSDPYD